MGWKLQGPIMVCAHGWPVGPGGCISMAPCVERWQMNLWLNEEEGKTAMLNDGEKPT